MPRRNYQTAKKGQVYAIEWPEWHVECAHPKCHASSFVAGLGEAFTVAEADKEALTEPEMKHWKKINGLWYCPIHAEQKR